MGAGGGGMRGLAGPRRAAPLSPGPQTCSPSGARGGGGGCYGVAGKERSSSGAASSPAATAEVEAGGGGCPCARASAGNTGERREMKREGVLYFSKTKKKRFELMRKFHLELNYWKAIQRNLSTFNPMFQTAI